MFHDRGVPFPVFLPRGNHFHLRSATTTPRDQVEAELSLSNKLFHGPARSCGSASPRPGSLRRVLQTASAPKKNTQGKAIPEGAPLPQTPSLRRRSSRRYLSPLICLRGSAPSLILCEGIAFAAIASYYDLSASLAILHSKLLSRRTLKVNRSNWRLVELTFWNS